MLLNRWATLILAPVALLSAVLPIWAERTIAVVAQIERFVQDARTATLLPAQPQDPRIVIVAVTEETLSRFPYRSPVDRAFISQLLQTLAQSKPSVIGVDILFDQPTEPAKDALLKQTIAELGVPLVVSYTDNPAIVNDPQRAYLDQFLPPEVRARAELNTDPVSGVVRWIFPGAPGPDGTYMPGFARAVALRVGVETPADAEEIAWRSKPDGDTPPFRVFQAHLVPMLPADWFKDKIVLIGEVVSLTDRHRTPFSVVYSGTEGTSAGIMVQAHAASQLIEHRHVSHLGLAGEFALALLLATIGTAFGLFIRNLARYLVFSLLILALLWSVGFGLVYYQGIFIPLIEPTLALLLATWGADVILGRRARRQREFIESAFSRYLSPQMVKQLSNDPGQLKLSGETREMTLMFCDIRGFTTLSERFDAQGLTRFINRFMTPMTEAILAANGTIDKYMGDAVMAFWNAPLADPLHALNGCRAALAMRTELVRFNAALRAEAEAEGRVFADVRIGIGLNTGECCVGNIGTLKRLNYSVLGDEVNLSSRLEGQTKIYGTDIVLGENTAVLVPLLATVELDLIKVKGKTNAVRIHALIGDESVAADPAFVALKSEHDAMLAAYRRRAWREARDSLRACLARAPEPMHPIYHLFEKRIDEIEINPPPGDWDGVYSALTK